MTRWSRRVSGGLRALVRRPRVERELDEELRAYLDAAIEHHITTGRSADDAVRPAKAEVGSLLAAKDAVRAVGWESRLESLWQDLRQAARGLRRSPGFTIPALAALVIGMGLAISLFATVDALLFSPWPVTDRHRVVSVHASRPLADGGTVFASGPAEFRYLREHSKTLDLFAFTTERVQLGADTPEASMVVRMVSGSYFSALRTPIVAGRGLADSDDQLGRPSPVIVISQAFWQSHFNGNPAAVGSTLTLENQTVTVVGIAARDAGDAPYKERPAGWMPLSASTLVQDADDLPQDADQANKFLTAANGCCVDLAARLGDEATIETADAELKVLASQFGAANSMAPNALEVTGTAGIHNPTSSRAYTALALLGVATFLVLLLGCANVANLQLARGLARRRDLAVRQSLGATRSRLVQQLLVEGLVLSVVAGVLSLGVAAFLPTLVFGRDLLLDQNSIDLSPDVSSVAVATVLAMLTCVSATLLPALKVTHVATSTHVVGAGRSYRRSFLLATQVAISAVLVVGACLLARGLHRAADSNLGFNPYGVYSVDIFAPDAMAPQEAQAFSARLRESVLEAGGGPVADTEFVPFSVYRASYDVRLSLEEQSRKWRAVTHFVSPNYFELLGIPFVAGKTFDGSRADDVIVNESLARLLWGAQPALGRTFEDKGQKRVVGVVADAHVELYERVSPAYYSPIRSPSSLLVRLSQRQAAGLEESLSRLAPGGPRRVGLVTSRLRRQLAAPIEGASMAAVIAFIALLLASVGTFAVFSYVVGERVKEIGVRLALGARTSDVVRSLARRMSWPLVGGLCSGVLAAQGLGSILGSQLYGVSPYDPLAALVTVLVMAAAAAFALAAPARRAARIDPATILRHD